MVPVPDAFHGIAHESPNKGVAFARPGVYTMMRVIMAAPNTTTALTRAFERVKGFSSTGRQGSMGCDQSGTHYDWQTGVPPMLPHPIASVIVAVPARNEQALIASCLRSIHGAFDHARTELGTRCPQLFLIVVADGCVDRTAELARAQPGVCVIEQPPTGVGAARQAAIAVALRALPVPPSRAWIINTDADSHVEPNWIVEHLHHADQGADVLIGTVRPEFDDLSQDQVTAWRASHHRGQPNGHIHGANLGVRASTYLEVGGFSTMREHEDVDLVGRARQGGYAIAVTDSTEVVTSGRQVGRTPGGYARYLREDLRLLSTSLT